MITPFMLSSLVEVVGSLAVLVLSLKCVVGWDVLGGVLVSPGAVLGLVVHGVGSLVLGVVVVAKLVIELLWLVVDAVGGLIDVLMVGDHGVVLVVDGTGVGFVLELDVGLLLVVLLVVRVVVNGLLVVNGVLMVHMGVLVVVLVGVLVGELVDEFVVNGLLVVRVEVVVVAILVMGKSLMRGHVVMGD